MYKSNISINSAVLLFFCFFSGTYEHRGRRLAECVEILHFNLVQQRTNILLALAEIDICGIAQKYLRTEATAGQQVKRKMFLFSLDND